MATPVWTYPAAHGGFSVESKVDRIVHDLGDGIIRTAMLSQSWSKQDGTGGADTESFGYRIFKWTTPIRTSSDAFAVIDFIRARRDNFFQSFYLYDPLVTPDMADWDGSTIAGRHLVKHLSEAFSYSVESYLLSRLATFSFTEVRS